MKRELLLSLFYCLSFLMVLSCSDDKEDLLPVDDEWTAANEAKIEEIKKDPQFTALKSLNEMGTIYYKVRKKAEETEDNPLIKYNEKVYANYTGSLINGKVFIGQNKEDGPLTAYTVGTATGNVSAVGTTALEGWNTALQYMRIGDEWEIWVPENLGYGRNGLDANSVYGITVHPYSALHFIIEVVDVERIK